MSEEHEPYTKSIVGVITQRFRADGVCYRQDFEEVDRLFRDECGNPIPCPENHSSERIRFLQPYDQLEQPLTDETVRLNDLGFVVGVVAVPINELMGASDVEGLLRNKLLDSKTQKLVKLTWRIIGFDERESKTLHISIVAELVNLESQSRILQSRG